MKVKGRCRGWGSGFRVQGVGGRVQGLGVEVGVYLGREAHAVDRARRPAVRLLMFSY